MEKNSESGKKKITNIYLFSCLHQVLVAAHGICTASCEIFCCGVMVYNMWVTTRDGTRNSCIARQILNLREAPMSIS